MVRTRASTNRQARGKGSRAEGLLLRQLEQQGYEARRTHMSLFPDIIAWTATDLLLIEVKARRTTLGLLAVRSHCSVVGSELCQTYPLVLPFCVI